MDIDAGASSIDFYTLGNANFERFSFDGGAGSFSLDFRGEAYSGTVHISVDIGVGSADVTLPKGIPVQLEVSGSGFLSSIDIHNNDLDEVDEDIFESEDFDSADTRIIMELNVALGSIDVRWRK